SAVRPAERYWAIDAIPAGVPGVGAACRIDTGRGESGRALRSEVAHTAGRSSGPRTGCPRSADAGPRLHFSGPNRAKRADHDEATGAQTARGAAKARIGTST